MSGACEVGVGLRGFDEFVAQTLTAVGREDGHVGMVIEMVLFKANSKTPPSFRKRREKKSGEQPDSPSIPEFQFRNAS